MTPYFQKSVSLNLLIIKTQPLNDELYSQLENLNSYDINTLFDEDSIKNVPDGTILINKINNKEFSYKLQVNDQKFFFYHRSNGVTRSEIYNQNKKGYVPILNVINGMLSIADLFNRDYFTRIFDDVFVASGVQIMPFSSNVGENVQRIINVAGSTFYPLAMSLLMPLFMYTIVLEKEVIVLMNLVKTNRNNED